MAKSLFEELGGKYERQGDYLIPCLPVPAEEERPIDVWGQRRLRYLKQHHKILHYNLLTSGKLHFPSCGCRGRSASTLSSAGKKVCRKGRCYRTA